MWITRNDLLPLRQQLCPVCCRASFLPGGRMSAEALIRIAYVLAPWLAALVAVGAALERWFVRDGK